MKYTSYRLISTDLFMLYLSINLTDTVSLRFFFCFGSKINHLGFLINGLIEMPNKNEILLVIYMVTRGFDLPTAAWHIVERLQRDTSMTG